MKPTTLTIALIALPLIIGSIVLIGAFISIADDSESVGQQSETSTSTVYTAQQVAEHSQANDCWIVIEDKVYDVSNFLQAHPGGVERIIPHCGQDASTAFATQDGTGGTHSTMAHHQLASLQVGILAQGNAESAHSSASADIEEQ